MNKTHFVLGGDIQKTLTEGHLFDFKKLFTDAFIITKKNFWVLFSGYLLLQLMTAPILNVILAEVNLINEGNANEGLSNNSLLALFVFFLITPPILTSFKMMGINHSIGLKSKLQDMFHYMSRTVTLVLATMLMLTITIVSMSLLSSLFGQLGAMLSIVLFLYLNMSFSLTYPLIAEKRLPPISALITSFKLVNKCLNQFTLLYILMSVLFVIAAIPAGLGLLIFMPFYYNLAGIVYRQICGVGVVATEVVKNDDDSNDDSGQSDAEKSNRSKNSSEFEA